MIKALIKRVSFLAAILCSKVDVALTRVNTKAMVVSRTDPGIEGKAKQASRKRAVVSLCSSMVDG